MISLSSICNKSLYFFEQNLSSVANAQQQKIKAIALGIFTILAATFLFYRYFASDTMNNPKILKTMYKILGPGVHLKSDNIFEGSVVRLLGTSGTFNIKKFIDNEPKKGFLGSKRNFTLIVKGLDHEVTYKTSVIGTNPMSLSETLKKDESCVYLLRAKSYEYYQVKV